MLISLCLMGFDGFRIECFEIGVLRTTGLTQESVMMVMYKNGSAQFQNWCV